MTIPQIRFKGFNEDWKQKNNLFEFVKGEQCKPIEDGIYPHYNGGQSNSNYFDNYNAEDCIIISEGGNSCGYVNLIKGKFWAGGHCYLVKNGELNRDYLYQLPKSNEHKIMSLRVGSGLPNVQKTSLQELALSFTKNKLEQQAIATFLTDIDTLIKSHKEKLEKTLNIKKAFLIKMFPTENAKTPEIRFNGFTGDWHEKELGVICDKVTEKNRTLEYTETFTNSAEFGIINQRDFFDKDISNASNIGGYYIIKANDFVYNPRISNFAPCGPIKRNKLGRTGIMSPLYSVFRVKNADEVDYAYLDTLFETGFWHSFMFRNGDNGARGDRFSIKDDVFMQMPIPLPDFPEQQAIGEFFSNLDKTILLHQKETTILENIKATLLCKMFAKV